MKLVPKRRFRGFSGEWNFHRFTDHIVSMQIGTNLLGTLSGTGMPLLKMGNIQRGYFTFEKLEYLDVNTLEQDSIVMYGDFLFNTRNTLELVGKGATWIGESGKYAFNSNIARFEFSGVDTLFFNYLYNTAPMVAQTRARAVGSTSVAAIYPRDLNSMKYYLPSISEQDQIGSYFLKLDKLIRLHQNKFQKLQAMKQAYLHEMFPAEGESVPKRRFEGFTGEWKTQELGEIAQITMGQSPSSNNYTNNPSDHILVQGNLDMKNNRVCPRIWTKQVTKKANRGDIILTVRAPVGDVGKTDYDVVLGRGVAGIKGNEFLFQLLIKLKVNDFWSNLSTGSTFDSINSDDIRTTEVPIPIIEEQQKIGSFFRKLDERIAKQEEKVEKLKAMKRAYLHEMFV